MFARTPSKAEKNYMGNLLLPQRGTSNSLTEKLLWGRQCVCQRHYVNLSVPGKAVEYGAVGTIRCIL